MERWICKPSFVRCDQPRNQSSGCKRDEENQKTKQRREIGARLFRLWARSLFAGGFQLLLAVTAPGDDTDPGHARCHQSDQARFGSRCGTARIIGECKETKRAKQSSKTYKSHGFLLGRPSAETGFKHILTRVEMASRICRMWFSKCTSTTAVWFASSSAPAPPSGKSCVTRLVPTSRGIEPPRANGSVGTKVVKATAVEIGPT